MRRTVLATGGAGFVGSHCILELLKSNYDVVVIDNMSNAVCNEINSNDLPESLRRVEKLTGRKLVSFYQVDLLDEKMLDYIFSRHDFDCVIHFAALKAVGESVKIPLSYYRNNVTGTINLLEAMKRSGLKKFIFSSSATVYGKPEYLPIDENHPTGVSITNPYGRTKYFIEEILKDISFAEKGWQILSLRYFNPVGAHESGEIGEDPLGTPNNLMPFIAQVAAGIRKELQVFGNDFDTPDGTGIRDYIHIMDLARGHVMGIDKLLAGYCNGFNVVNLGTSRGFSVLEVVEAFEKATGIKINYIIVKRRPGDVDAIYADSKKAYKVLGWKPEYGLLDICKHTWKWQSKNKNGYRST